MCKYNDQTVVLNISPEFSFDELVRDVCARWTNLNPNIVSLSYSLPGHPKCMLHCDLDVRNMMGLLAVIGLKCVDVAVVERFEPNDVDNPCLRGKELTNHVQYGKRQREELDVPFSFCGNQDTQCICITDAWANGITHVNQEFIGGANEFRKTLCKYAIGLGFNFKYVRNDMGRVTAKYAMKETKGCPWRIHASLQKSTGFFYVKRFNRQHTCGAAVRSMKSPKTSFQNSCNIFQNGLRSNILCSLCHEKNPMVAAINRDPVSYWSRIGTVTQFPNGHGSEP